jgi:flagellar basal-body rod modification protein FlgD
MAAAAGIWNHHAQAGQALTGNGATPLTGPGGGSGGGGGTGGSGGNSATISANDFLTLLVTEMQNQDPTAATDPNEYINQLVSVNSLEQLISINQNLSTALGLSNSGSSSPATAGGTTATAGSSAASHPGAAGAAAVVGSKVAGAHPAGATAVPNAPAKHASGNLSVPEEKPAAHRVAQALGGRPHARHA